MLKTLLAIAITVTATAPAFATPSSTSAATAPPISIAFCRETFANAAQTSRSPLTQLIIDADAAGLKGDARAQQIGVCAVYFQGMMDYIVATSPTT